ncbi:P-loop containing nucleoside triphosphate hydrolase protein [Lactifluus volemus]|nr:P-loop containing nucleoside triphosphate hydrolase protein [Lactifluus volemus]
MSSSPLRRRSSRSSVLGKRTHQSQFDTATSTASIKSVSADHLDDNDDASTIDLTPCAKRPRTSLAPTDRNGNKENIPPLRVGLLIGSPRALRRSSTEFVTPTHSRMTLRRHASTSNLVIPDTSIAHLGLQTPPLTPSVSIPLHIRTRALLRATCNGSTEIAGRIPERQFIRNFISESISSRPTSEATRPVLYISGSPGCGKTALVNSILATFEVELLKNNVKLVVINCMALNGLEAVWERMIEELGSPDKWQGKTRSCEIVGKLLSNRTSKCIIILDEIDHVAASSQTLTSLFALARNHSSTLRIIGIANTHTLTSSASALSVDGVSGVSTLHFSPYDPEQLLSILQSRLKPLASLESPTLEAVVQRFLPVPTLSLLSKKIAAQTGDVRSLFEVFEAQLIWLEKDTPPVTPSHILAALKAYAPASKVPPALPPQSGLHARLALLALLLACRRAEASLPLLSHPQASPPRSPVKRSNSSPTPPPATQTNIDMSQLHAFYGAILARGESGTFTPVSRSEFGDLAGVLETIGLVSLSSSSQIGRKLSRTTSSSNRSMKGLTSAQQNRSVTFVEGIRPDEVLRGLGIDAEKKDICEEEVEGIWKRELSRIRKETRIRQPSTDTITLGFDDATEE